MTSPATLAASRCERAEQEDEKRPPRSRGEYSPPRKENTLRLQHRSRDVVKREVATEAFGLQHVASNVSFVLGPPLGTLLARSGITIQLA